MIGNVKLIAAIGTMTDHEACLVCNGYKDEEFIDLALYASKLGIPYAVFLGEDEIAAGACSVKDLARGEQVTVPTAEAALLIKNGLAEKNSGTVFVEYRIK